MALRKLHRRALGCAAAIVLAGGVWTGIAQAAETVKAFDIPAKALAEALVEFSRQSDVIVVAPQTMTSGKISSAVSGTMTPQQAVEQLLKGTQLRYIIEADGSIVVRGANQEVSNRPVVEEILVQGVRFHDDIAGTAMKVPLSIKDTPQTVLAITGDVMDFAAIKTFQDVYRVDATGGTTHRTDNFTVNYFRGFRQQSNNAIKIDGFRLRADFNLDFAPLERLELVKGSTSTLYGQNSIAGTLNAVSKMPQDQFGGSAKLEVGSFNHYRVDADVYGPLTDDGALTYRIVGARLDEDSYLDYAGKKTTVFAPTLRYEFTPDTSAYVRFNYQKFNLVPQWGTGLQYLGDIDQGFATGFDPTLLVIADVPRSFFNGASWNHSEFEAKILQASLEHRFADGWTLRLNAQHNDQDLLYEQRESGFPQANGVPWFAFVARNDNEFTLDGAELNVYGDVELFGRAQTLFLGVDYSKLNNPLLYSSFYDMVSPSIFDPSYNTAVARPGVSEYTDLFQRRLTQESFGVTAQVFIRPLDRLTLLLGGRYSHDQNADGTRFGDATLPGSDTPFDVLDLKTSVTTLQAGLTYALTPDLNFYASYGETFEPQTLLAGPNRFIDPEEGVAKEIGLKGALSARFSYSLALFDMERSNIAQGRFGTPFSDPIGTQRSRGVEVEFQGTLIPGWELFGSLGWLDAEFIDGEFKGYRPENAPKFGLSMFTSYEIQNGALQGIGVGAGVVYKSGRTNFFTQLGTDGLPLRYDFGDYTEVDLRIFRNFKRWRLQLAATNLFNEKYYTPAYNGFGFGVHVNPARTVIGHVLYQF
ncbi:MAG TPA: TonB-dependent siderophore receptor [Povalibacter sp.]|nr:TonB-dependent siderophore receptor [Povalibacter sp.]